MKKTFKVLAVVAMALGMFFTSCSQQVSNIEVVTVDASEITVKSYPGCNEISWTPVSNAKYVLYKNGVKLTESEDTTVWPDSSIVDGVEYTYTVYTLPKDLVVKSEFSEESIQTIGGNKVAYYTKGNKSSVTVTAIVPPFTKDGALVTALDLIDYDPNANAEAKVTAENISFIYDDVDNKFKIEFPAVEYLTYQYLLYKGNSIEVFGEFATSDKEAVISQNAELGKGRASVSNYGLSAGEYTLKVKVSKGSYKASEIIAANKITVEDIDVAENLGTRDLKAAYIDNGENARVMWLPAVKTDKTTLWPEANYIVYVKDTKGVYTAINEVKAASTDDEGNEIAAEYAAKVGAKEGDTVYYVDYPVVNNKLTYDFYVVLNCDGELESSSKTVPLAAYADLKELTFNGTATAKFIDADTDELKNDVLLTFTGLAKDQKIESVKYLKYNKNTANANEPYVPDTCVLDENFTEVPAASSVDTNTWYVDDTTGYVYNTGVKYTYLVKDLEEDEGVVFLYEISQEGGFKSLFGTTKAEDLGVYTPSANAYSPITLTGTREDSTKDWTYDFEFYAVSNNTTESYDVANNWTYSVYYGLVENDVEGVKKWNSIGAITPKLNETKTAWEAKVEDVTLAAKTPEYDPTTNDVTGYKSTYQIKIVAKYNLVDNVEEVTYREVEVAKDAE